MYKPKGNVFEWQGKVYFGDTDAAGVVYHGKYIYWLEAARIDFFEAIGCPYTELQADKIGFIPVEINIKYLRSLKFGDSFVIKVWISKLTRATIFFNNVVECNGQKISESVVKLACVDESKWKPMAVPQKVETCLEHFETC
jgi:acyl-CoA thioester hydrolase